MTGYTAETLDLSRLPAPSLVDATYATILQARLDHLAALWATRQAIDPTLRDIELLIKSSTEVLLTEEYATGDMLLRQAINDAANALRLAKAVGGDLEHLTATYHRTTRKLIASTPAGDLYESDDELRSRAQLAPEALAEMGLTPGGYVYKIRTAFADRIKHVFPINRGAGRVELRVLGRDGDGTVPPALIAEIIAAFQIEEGSQTTDVLTILSADVQRVSADVTLFLPPGPDPDAVKAQAAANLAALGTALHRINAPVYREALSTAAHVGSAITVRVNAPSTDLLRAPEVAPYLASDAITVSHEVLS